jgi:glycosyltransferase involved in cell wall biosynthesis
MSTRLAVVIPAYRPSAGLVDLIRNLAGREFTAIVVVDDGSGPEFAGTFAAVAGMPQVHLLRHAVNLGKGAALKTAFNYVLCTFPDVAGVVTADADGQHHPGDVARVAETLLARTDALVLGARTFGERVPLRSRVGNIATRGIVHALLGQKIADTQTGLRGIPASLLPRLLRIESRGYEFELEMLIAAHQLAMPVVEVPIQTIYERGNKSSHFNPVIDSMKIYFVLLRFGSVSLMTALLDNLVFILAQPRLHNILTAQILGRAVAVVFNYSTVRRSVFYSRQRHKTVLPKYLSLVVASGTCSYFGIQLLSTRLGVPVIPAKLLVETFLFFVNFAVQRLFIFRQESPAAKRRAPKTRAPKTRAPKTRMPIHPFALLVGVAFAALVALEVFGVRTYHLFSQDLWLPNGWKRFIRYTEYYAAAAAILMIVVPRYFPAAIAGALALSTMIAVGPVPLLATAFFLLSANALGERLLGRSKPPAPEHHVCATLLGTAIYIFLMSLTARLPVNYALGWGALLAIPIVMDLRGVRDRLAAMSRALLPPETPRPAARAGLAALVFVLVAHWFVVLKPEQGADALAMHLAIPMNIAANHAMTYQPSRIVWAVMPMGADFAYTIVYMLGGEYATRLFDFAMLLAIVALLYRASRRWLGPGPSYLLAASFAATPIVQLVTGSLFVENVLAAMIFGLMTAVWMFDDSGERRYFYLAMLLGGCALSIKFGATAFVVIAVPFAIGAARRHWRSLGARPAAACAIGAALLLVAAAPPYATAYARTGNPLFPFLDQKFHSGLLPPGTDLRDDRYRQPLTWRSLYDLVIHTSRYYEGQDGSAGFQYLVLAPLGLLGLLIVRPRPAVSAATVALGAGLVILKSEPNVRYVYAALPLVLVPAASLLGWLASQRPRTVYGLVVFFLAAAAGLNAYFIPSSSYYHKDFSLRIPLSRAEHERYLSEVAPLRRIVEYYSREHPGSVVLFIAESSIAGAVGDVYENHWHQFTNWTRIRETPDLASMRRLLEGWKIRYFIGHKQSPGDLVDPPALVEFLASCTVPEFEYDDYYLARYEPACNARTQPDPPLAVPTGYYDVYDPAMLFRGEWKHEQVPHGPDRDTVFTAEAPGAEVSMAFTGTTLYYEHGAGPDHGIAAVTIDGRPQKPVDLFWPEPDWLHRATFCCLAPGKHVVVIRATGEKNPRARAAKIDIDSISVR